MSLSAAELALIRTDYETEILDQTCTIQTKTEVSDGMGGHSNTWGNTYENVACRLGVRSSAGSLEERGGREAFTDEYTLNLHWDQAVAVGNRAVVGSTTYEVVHVKDQAVQWVGLRAVTVKEIKP